MLEVISHSIKESLVRSKPLNTDKFNFKISLGQFIIGLLITPIIVSIYLQAEPKDGGGSSWAEISDYLD